MSNRDKHMRSNKKKDNKSKCYAGRRKKNVKKF